MCERCEELKSSPAKVLLLPGELDDATAVRKSTNDAWEFAIAQIPANKFEERIRFLSGLAADAALSGRGTEGSIYSLALTALLELLARKLEHEAAAETAAAN